MKENLIHVLSWAIEVAVMTGGVHPVITKGHQDTKLCWYHILDNLIYRMQSDGNMNEYLEFVQWWNGHEESFVNEIQVRFRFIGLSPVVILRKKEINTLYAFPFSLQDVVYLQDRDTIVHRDQITSEANL